MIVLGYFFYAKYEQLFSHLFVSYFMPEWLRQFHIRAAGFQSVRSSASLNRLERLAQSTLTLSLVKWLQQAPEVGRSSSAF